MNNKKDIFCICEHCGKSTKVTNATNDNQKCPDKVNADQISYGKIERDLKTRSSIDGIHFKGKGYKSTQPYTLM